MTVSDKNFANCVKTRTKSRTNIDQLKRDNTFATDNKEIADELKNFFHKHVFKGRLIWNCITVYTEECAQVKDKMTLTRPIIKKKVVELRKDAAARLDDITHKLLKALGHSIRIPYRLYLKNKLKKEKCRRWENLRNSSDLQKRKQKKNWEL